MCTLYIYIDIAYQISNRINQKKIKNKGRVIVIINIIIFLFNNSNIYLLFVQVSKHTYKNNMMNLRNSLIE